MTLTGEKSTQFHTKVNTLATPRPFFLLISVIKVGNSVIELGNDPVGGESMVVVLTSGKADVDRLLQHGIFLVERLADELTKGHPLGKEKTSKSVRKEDQWEKIRKIFILVDLSRN